MQVISENPRGVFEGQKRVQIHFDMDEDKDRGPSRSRVKPEFLKDSLISNIMKKASRTGFVNVRQVSFGDFTSTQDFLQRQNAVIEFTKFFDSLPSATREFFANDPANVLDFVKDPKNRDKAVELKVLKKSEAAPAPLAPAPPATPVNPAPAAPVVPA